MDPQPQPNVEPVFVLTLPRSGSTLLQRVLATYPEVATASEPWVLLPLLTPLYRGAPGDVGWQGTQNTAIGEFVATLPGGQEEYLEEVRRIALSLYAKAAGNGPRYFLDKGPYHWIVEGLFRVFPNGRFIFLWRHPLAVLSSITATWMNGRWRPDRYEGALFYGIENLVAAYERHSDRAVSVRYEDLVDGSTASWEMLAEYLGLEFNPASMHEFTEVKLTGSTGDQIGTRQYSTLASAPLDKWRTAVNSPLRRYWCRRYLGWIGERRLATMGYDQAALLAELDSLHGGTARIGTDAVDGVTSVLREATLARLRGPRAPRTWSRLLRGE